MDIDLLKDGTSTFHISGFHERMGLDELSKMLRRELISKRSISSELYERLVIIILQGSIQSCFLFGIKTHAHAMLETRQTVGFCKSFGFFNFTFVHELT